MKSKVSMCRTMLAAAVVMASTSGMAFANDDSVRWVPDNAPSAWRQSHPDGLSVREMQSLWGSWAGQYRIGQPVFGSAPAEACSGRAIRMGCTSAKCKRVGVHGPGNIVSISRNSALPLQSRTSG